MVFCMFSCDKEDEAKPVYEYYENGNLKQSIEYDEDGGKLVNEYREDGKLTKETNDDGKGVVSITTYEYDENGNLILQNTICDANQENYSYKYKYTDNNLLYREEYYSNGYLSRVMQYSEDRSYYDNTGYDEKGNVLWTQRTNITYYDDGSRLETKENIDEGRENERVETCYTNDNKFIWWCRRVLKKPIMVEMKLDDSIIITLVPSGHETDPAVFNLEEALFYVVDQYGNRTPLHDNSSLSEKTETFENGGNICTRIKLYYKNKILLQETIIKGDVVPEDDFDFKKLVMRNVVFLPNGEVLYDTEADDSIYIVKSNTYGENLEDVVGYDLDSYNSTGKQIYSKTYDLDDNLIYDRYFEYDDDGNKIEVKYYDDGSVSSKRCYGSAGIMWDTDYYENGNVQSHTVFNEDGSEHTTRYSENGIMESEKFEKTDGSCIIIHYDEDGNKIDEKRWNSDGSRIAILYYENGNKKIEEHYDKNGNIVSSIYYDENGNIIS